MSGNFSPLKLRIFVKSFFCLKIITFGGKPNILRVSGKQTWKHKQVEGCQMAIQYLFKRLKDVTLDIESWCDNISFENLLEEKFLITNWDFLDLDIRFIIQQFYASTNLHLWLWCWRGLEFLSKFKGTKVDSEKLDIQIVISNSIVISRNYLI